MNVAAPPARILVPPVLDDLPRLPDAHAAVREWSGETMGTRWSVKCAPTGDVAPTVPLAIQQALDRIVGQMSTWLPSSELSVYNDAAAGRAFTLSAGFATVLDVALQLARDTGGAYDPSVGALVDLWGFGPAPRRTMPPSSQAIAAASARCGWRRLDFDAAQGRITQPGGLRLDLSSIAKGYGVDRVCDVLRASGIDHFLVEIGGELRGHGVKPDGLPWWVDIERTADDAAFTPLRIALHGLAVATSGDARRFFDADGTRHSHTIDPRSGRPIDDAVASVTVLHRECLHADALATAIAVMGVADGLAFAERRGLAARLVERRGAQTREHFTTAFAAMLG
ncbi:MAG TPA: FAD:protein FMN transferase [Solimonas sp.]|nr:FAD:protein FMN transferase [Solimonas sp.]